MNKLFVGMIFVFLNFNLEFGSMTIGLIPSFIGYIFIYFGMKELEGFSSHFSENKKICIPMTVYSFILYIINLFGILKPDEEFDLKFGIMIVCEFTTCILSLRVLYNIIKGSEKIEQRFFCNLNCEKLMYIWKADIALTIVTWLSLIFEIPLLSLIFIIAELVLIIVLIYQFNITRKGFYYILANQQEVSQ